MHRFESDILRQIQSRRDGVCQGTVVVACSGGGDSVALLVLLGALRRSLDLQLLVAHADHGLRAEAEEDAHSVRELCRAMDLDLVEAWLDVKGHARLTGQGLETAARELRWSWLRTEAETAGALAVATGHTLDDHTETVFLRLGRGSGCGALTPLAARQGLRWSPLVGARRLALRAYLRQIGCSWREDASNEDGFTPRNRLRPVLERLRQEMPALDRHLWETHRQVAELEALRDRTVASWRGEHWDFASGGGLRLRGGLGPTELKWILHAAFRELDWPLEASVIGDLATWLAPRLNQKSPRPKTWGGWVLACLDAGPTPSDKPWRTLTRSFNPGAASGHPIS